MAQLEALKKEINYLKNCIDRQQGKTNRLEWEVSQLESRFLQFADSSDRDYWQVTEDIAFLKGGSFSQQDHLYDLNEQVYQVNKRLGRFTALHEDIKRALMAFRKKCVKVVRATLRLANEVREEDLKLELLVDWEMDNYDASDETSENESPPSDYNGRTVAPEMETLHLHHLRDAIKKLVLSIAQKRNHLQPYAFARGIFAVYAKISKRVDLNT